MSRVSADELGPARWDGTPGRLEVWYASLTDPATGTGVWLHHELVAPTADGAPYLHGWAAVFPSDAPPRVERFGPLHVAAPGDTDHWFASDQAVVGPGRMAGRAGAITWDLTHRDPGPPLYTFPAYVWHRQLLPSSQVVPSPTAEFAGRLTLGDDTITLDGATGGIARIHGHGNAHRWGWLHADLGGGDVLEVVAAVGRRPVLRPLPPVAFAQLRTGGRDWPSDPLVAALGSRVRLDLPRWYATVRTPTRRLRVGVRVPPAAAVTLEYRDPDDAVAWCTNSCRADAEIRLEHRHGRRWQVEQRWSLRGTAHAEFGERPA